MNEMILRSITMKNDILYIENTCILGLAIEFSSCASFGGVPSFIIVGENIINKLKRIAKGVSLHKLRFMKTFHYRW